MDSLVAAFFKEAVKDICFFWKRYWLISQKMGGCKRIKLWPLVLTICIISASIHDNT